MKRKTAVLKSSLLAGIFSLLFYLPSCASGSLKDITRPYLGEYECQRATLGEKDVLENFSFVKLELKDDGSFTIFYKTTDGKRGEEQGSYTYDDKEKTVSFSVGKNGALKRKFPLQEGKIDVVLPMGEKTLHLTFEQK